MTEELLATHQIISLFERSKMVSDQILDNLSGIFVNFESSGKILRSNRRLAELLNSPFEAIINKDLKTLFGDEQWEIFKSHLQAVSESGRVSPEFEVEIKASAGARSYIWQISLLPTKAKTREQQIFTCLGRDVTEVKQALALAKDLELTKAMQALLLPSENEFRSGRLALASAYEPAATAGGDFWWMNLVSEDEMWVLVGDVTGHGAGSAMVTSMVSGAIETLLRVHKPGELTLAIILDEINHRLMALRDQPYWMTATAIEVNCRKNQIRWWGAASPPFFLQRKSGEIEAMSGVSNPLGANMSLDLQAQAFPFSVGDRILVLTDGVYEATDKSLQQYGIRRVERYLKECTGRPIAQVRDGLIASVKKWCEAPDDDIAIVLIERLS